MFHRVHPLNNLVIFDYRKIKFKKNAKELPLNFSGASLVFFAFLLVWRGEGMNK